MVFLLLVALTAAYCGTGMVQAVDTWISLAGGRHIAAHGVGDADPFSFNSRPAAAAALGPGASRWARAWAWLHPTGWINQNWLTHLLLFELVETFGMNALVAFRFAIYLAVAALLLVACRLHGARLEIAAVATAATLVALRPFAEFRAQELTTLLTAALLVLLALAVRRAPRLLWGAVPLLALWANLHGGFIFGLLALGVYAVAAWLPRGGRRWLALAPDARWTGVAATLASIAISAAASPYRLANLTHPLAITVGPEASLWRRVNEWLPAIAPGARLGEVVPFFVVLATAALAVVLALRRGPEARRAGKGGAAGARVEWQPDLGALGLAAITTAMALKSMRFVALAAVTLAPVLAAALEEVVARGSRRPGRAAQRVAAALRGAPYVAASVTAALAVAWGVRFARVYVAPWPSTTAPVSLFERMTWGHRFRGVGEFLRANSVAGRAFNVWEEGGVLMWEQQPRPGAAKLPLEVYIDGRAQAAYPASIVSDYIELDLAGPVGAEAAAEGREPARDELLAMGRWTESRLSEQGVSVVVAPEERVDDNIFRALAIRPRWRLVYRDAFHRVLVDTADPTGRSLDAAVAAGSALFPEEASRLLTAATRALAEGDLTTRRQALLDAERSYALDPTAAAVETALEAGSTPALAGDAETFAHRLVEEYTTREATYRRQPGFLERARAAMLAANLLRSRARARGEAAEEATLVAFIERVARAREQTMSRALWWG